MKTFCSTLFLLILSSTSLLAKVQVAQSNSAYDNGESSYSPDILRRGPIGTGTDSGNGTRNRLGRRNNVELMGSGWNTTTEQSPKVNPIKTDVIRSKASAIKKNSAPVIRKDLPLIRD
ncbi:MAG: hypothetical protein ACOYL6_14570 [Bacteriovoracaceae bacterium]